MANNFNFIDDMTLDGVLWMDGILESPNSTVTAITQIGTLSITSSSNKTLNTILTNTGNIVHNSSSIGEVFFVDGAVINNNNSYEFQQGVIEDDFTGLDNGVFNNSGTLTKTTTNTATIEVDFNNTGTVNVQEGTLIIGDNGVSDGGDFDISNSGFLTFSAGTNTLKNGAQIIGNGSLTVSSIGTLDLELAGGTAIASTVEFNLDGGTFEVDGNWTLPSISNWNGGSLVSSGVITNTGDLSITSSSNKTLDATLTNTGNIVHNSSIIGEIFLVDGAVINNNNSYEFQQGVIEDDFTGLDNGVFNNSGTLTKTTTNTATIEVDFNNTGTVNVQEGTLIIGDNGVSDGGDFDISNSGFLTFSAGTNTLKNGAQIIGNGSLTVSSIGTLDLELAGGTAIASTVEFNLDGGTFEVDGNWTLPSISNWNGGSLVSSGVITNTGDLSITSSSNKTLDATLTNTGNIVHNSSIIGEIFLVDGAVINNNNSYEFQQGDIEDDFLGLDNGLFNNSGTLTKTTVNTASICVDFINTGTVIIEEGTLSFCDIFTQNNGQFSLRGGNATIDAFNNAVFNGGTFGGFGTFTGNINTSTILDIGYFNNTEYGQFIIDGNYTETNSSNIDIEIGGYTSGTEFDFLDITGVANFDGTLNVTLLNNFVPVLGDTFEIINFGSYTGALEFTNVSINNDLQFDIQYFADKIILVVEEAPNTNQTPDAIDDNATVASGQTVFIDVLANDSDPDPGDIISIEDTFLLNTANGGIVTLNNNSTPNDPSDDTLVYTAPSNFIGDDTFVYTITDGDLSDTATVTVSVTGATSVDLPPIVANHIMPVFAQEDAADTILDLSNVFTDPDNDDSGISISVLSNSNSSLVNASVNGNDLILDYQPNQFGFSFITLQATSNGKTVTEAFGVIVNEVVEVDPPVANNDTGDAKSGEAIALDVLANDTGSGISLDNNFPLTTALGGTVTLNDNNTPSDGTDDTLTYTAPVAATGNDTFTYSITDSNNNSDTATVTIAVNIGEGTEGDDYLICTDNDDIILGLGGNDTLEGLGGNDSYDGGEGDDTFVISGGGIDTIQDSSGNDTLDASKASSGSYIDLTPGGSNTSIDGGTVILGATLNNNTDIVFVVDISGSTSDPFAGTSVGDLNSDGNVDQIIDAEIDGGILINQLLIDQGLGNSADIAIVSFANNATQVGSVVKPLTDSNNNGTPDLEDSLRSLTSGGATNYEAALQEAAQIFNSLGTASVDFLHKGLATQPTRPQKDHTLREFV